MEFFLVHIFLYSDWIQENTDQKNLRIRTLFTQCVIIKKSCNLIGEDYILAYNLDFVQ